MARSEAVNRGDRIVILGLALALALIGGAMLLPASPSGGNRSSELSAPFVPYREGVIGHPSSVNPLTARTQADQDLVALLFRGLVREGPDGSILPDLAETWTSSADGRTYTFQLSADAYWEDGEPVTAADVAFTIGLLQDPTYDGPYGSSWQGIHVTAESPSTVRFNMTLPIASFLRQAALPILPQHLLDGVSASHLADSPYSARPIGDGPYRLVALDQSHAVLQRVPSVVRTNSPLPPPTASAGASSTPGPGASSTPSAGPTPTPASKASASQSEAPTPTPTATPTPTPTATPTPTPTATTNAPTGPQTPLDTIELEFFDDAQSAAAQFVAGKLDAVGGLTPQQTDVALTAPGSRLVAYRWTSLLGVVLNQRVDHPEMRDANARIGLMSAIDRAGLLTGVLEGRGSTAEVPIPSWSSAFDATVVVPTPYDTADAISRLTTAGWQRNGAAWIAPKASGSYALDLLTPNEESNPIVYRTALQVAADWRAIGLDVTLNAVPAATYVSRLSSGVFAAAVVDFEVGLDPDLGPLLLSSQVGSGGSNVSGVQDAVLDQLLLTARKTIDQADRQTAISAVEKYVSTTEPILPLAFRDYDLVVSRRVQSVSGTQISRPSSRYWDVIDWRLASDG